MGAREYDDWSAYYAVEPWGSYRDNLHAGIIAATVANAHKGKRAKALTPADFMLRSKSEQRATDTRRSLAHLRAIAQKRPKNGN